MARKGTQSYSIERRLGGIHGEISLTTDHDAGTIQHSILLRHDDGTAVSTTIKGDGKRFDVTVLLEKVFGSPASFNHTLVPVSDSEIEFRNVDWMGTAARDFRMKCVPCEDTLSCSQRDAVIAPASVLTDWKPGMRYRIQNVATLEEFAPFMAEWQAVIVQDAIGVDDAVSDRRGITDELVKALSRQLKLAMCEAVCLQQYFEDLAVEIRSIWDSSGTSLINIPLVTAKLAACKLQCLLESLNNALNDTLS